MHSCGTGSGRWSFRELFLESKQRPAAATRRSRTFCLSSTATNYLGSAYKIDSCSSKSRGDPRTLIRSNQHEFPTTGLGSCRFILSAVLLAALPKRLRWSGSRRRRVQNPVGC